MMSNDERISHHNIYNEGDIGRCEVDFAKEILTRESKYYENHNSQFYEASCRFNILFMGQLFDPFTVNINYYKSWCINYPINPNGKRQKSHNDKKDDLIDDVFEKFNPAIVHVQIIRNREFNLLHHNFGYLKEWCGDYENESFYLFG